MTKKEHDDSLWNLASSPLIWAAHFLLSYITAAVYCAKVESTGTSLAPVRIAIAIYTLVALAAITRWGWMGWRRHRTSETGIPHDEDSPEDRQRFVGLATFLLSALSFIATVFVALTIFFVGDCN